MSEDKLRAGVACSLSFGTQFPCFTGTKVRILTHKALPGHGDYSVAHPWHAKEVAWNQDNVQDLVNGDRARVLRVLRLLCETALQRTVAGFVKVWRRHRGLGGSLVA